MFMLYFNISLSYTISFTFFNIRYFLMYIVFTISLLLRRYFSIFEIFYHFSVNTHHIYFINYISGVTSQFPSYIYTKY